MWLSGFENGYRRIESRAQGVCLALISACRAAAACGVTQALRLGPTEKSRVRHLVCQNDSGSLLGNNVALFQ